MVAKEKKGKGKKFHSKSKSGKYGKKNEKYSESTAGEALASQFELELLLIPCMVSSAMGLVCYLDSGASFHMTGDKELLSSLEGKDL